MCTKMLSLFKRYMMMLFYFYFKFFLQYHKSISAENEVGISASIAATTATLIPGMDTLQVSIEKYKKIFLAHFKTYIFLIAYFYCSLISKKKMITKMRCILMWKKTQISLPGNYIKFIFL